MTDPAVDLLETDDAYVGIPVNDEAEPADAEPAHNRPADG